MQNLDLPAAAVSLAESELDRIARESPALDVSRAPAAVMLRLLDADPAPGEPAQISRVRKALRAEPEVRERLSTFVSERLRPARGSGTSASALSALYDAPSPAPILEEDLWPVVDRRSRADPGDGLRASVSEGEAEAVFERILRDPRFAPHCALGGCEFRAHRVARALERQGIRSYKIFASPEQPMGTVVLAVNESATTSLSYFNRHVAVVIDVDSAEGTRPMALDPVFFDRPVGLEDWRRRFKKGWRVQYIEFELADRFRLLPSGDGDAAWDKSELALARRRLDRLARRHALDRDLRKRDRLADALWTREPAFRDAAHDDWFRDWFDDPLLPTSHVERHWRRIWAVQREVRLRTRAAGGELGETPGWYTLDRGPRLWKRRLGFDARLPAPPRRSARREAQNAIEF